MWDGTERATLFYLAFPTSTSPSPYSLPQLPVARNCRKKLYQRLLRTLNFLALYLAQGKLRLRLIILHAPSFKTKKRVPAPPPSPVEEPPPLVARQEEPLTTNTHLVYSSRCHFLDRRIPFRMGQSLHPRFLRLRTSPPHSVSPPHQRTNSCTSTSWNASQSSRAC